MLEYWWDFWAFMEGFYYLFRHRNDPGAWNLLGHVNELDLDVSDEDGPGWIEVL